MEWLRVNDMSGNIIRMPIDRIDHIEEDPHSIAAKLFFKNGRHCMVDATTFYKTELRPLSSDDIAVIRRRCEILKEDLAQANLDIQNRDDEIQDLKLENDRLKKRDELMSSLIYDATCHASCNECRFSIDKEPCKLNVCRRDINLYHELMNELYSVFEKLEDL